MTRDERVRNTLLEMPSGGGAGWGWLPATNSRRATKKQANKFMLGAIMDYHPCKSVVSV